MLDNLKNFFKKHYKIQILIIIVAGILVTYEIISELLYNSVIFSTPVQIILMLILITIGILIFYNSPNFEIEYSKYPLTAHRIVFTNKHQGTDGLCCFLTKQDKGVPFKRTDDILLIFGAITKEPNDLTIKELLETHSISMFVTRKKCEKLEFVYEIKDNFLFINFSCNDYSNRPQSCRNYPLKNDIACIYEKYCSAVQLHLQYFNWASLFMYAFDSNKYPELEKFSIGTVTKASKTYFIIPIPLKLNREILCPKGDSKDEI